MNVESPCLMKPPARIADGVAAALRYAVRLEGRSLPLSWQRLLTRLDAGAR